MESSPHLFSDNILELHEDIRVKPRASSCCHVSPELQKKLFHVLQVDRLLHPFHVQGVGVLQDGVEDVDVSPGPTLGIQV